MIRKITEEDLKVLALTGTFTWYTIVWNGYAAYTSRVSSKGNDTWLKKAVKDGLAYFTKEEAEAFLQTVRNKNNTTDKWLERAKGESIQPEDSVTFNKEVPLDEQEVAYTCVLPESLTRGWFRNACSVWTMATGDTDQRGTLRARYLNPNYKWPQAPSTTTCTTRKKQGLPLHRVSFANAEPITSNVTLDMHGFSFKEVEHILASAALGRKLEKENKGFEKINFEFNC